MATLRIVESMLAGAGGYRNAEAVIGIETVPWPGGSDAAERRLLVRTGSPTSRDCLLRMNAARIPYAYYIDDNFWLLNGESALDRYYQHPFVRESLELAITGASAVICHSEAFRRLLLRFNANVIVVQPHFDFDLLDSAFVQHDEFRIGVVGNSSRASDIAFLVDVVRGVLARSPVPVVFEFFGHTPEVLEGESSVRSFAPIKDYKAFIQAQQERGWTVGLAPLMDTPFARYKTNNKFREFGACGIAGIYSDTPVYRECVDHGETGWILPNEAEQWTNQLLRAISDPHASRAIGAAAQRTVRERHDARMVRQHWVRVLEDALAPATGYRRARSGVASMLVKLFDRMPTDGHVTLNSRGSHSGKVWRERLACPRRRQMFQLDPGESLTTLVHPFVMGMNVFSLLLATYGRQASGTLIIDVRQSGKDERQEIDLSLCADGGTVPLRLQANSMQALRVTVTNAADGTIGLYSCTRLGSTSFEAQGRRHRFGVLA